MASGAKTNGQLRGLRNVPSMILGPISFLDCFVFITFLVPQLLWRIGLFETFLTALHALPYLLLRLPFEFLYERLLLPKSQQSPFVQRASAFEDFVIRCVRYAFANVDPKIGRVFFSKEVSLPFLWFRLLRHGYLQSPMFWREYNAEKFKGIWVMKEPLLPPDIVIYYAHGGGFSMGSTYFYLEFLMSWMTLLEDAGYRNPAIFGLEYTLVNDASFPTQLLEVVHGYEHVLEVARDPSLVCVSGDSAGATLILSMLLYLADQYGKPAAQILAKPRLAVLISPWVTLLSARHKNTASDYLNADALHRYGMQYMGSKAFPNDPVVSPGTCQKEGWWTRASPREGFFITYGAEEVFATDIEDLIALLTKGGVPVASVGEEGGVHAWPVASLFLSTERAKRLKGLNGIVEQIREKMP